MAGDHDDGCGRRPGGAYVSALTPEQVEEVRRIVESAEFFSRCHGDWQQRTLRVPREQPPPAPASAEAKCTRKVLEWLASAEPKCTCKRRYEAHAGYASIEQVDHACPEHGPAAEDDEENRK